MSKQPPDQELEEGQTAAAWVAGALILAITCTFLTLIFLVVRGIWVIFA